VSLSDAVKDGLEAVGLIRPDPNPFEPFIIWKLNREVFEELMQCVQHFGLDPLDLNLALIGQLDFGPDRLAQEPLGDFVIRGQIFRRRPELRTRFQHVHTSYAVFLEQAD
jgi:hypothetical protein